MRSIGNMLAAAAAALICLAAHAAPASPVPFPYVQPDGSVIRIRLHGDEFFSWHTNADTGQVIALGQDGWWRPSTVDESRRRAGVARRKAANDYRRQSPDRSRAPLRAHDHNPMTHGERHIPVFLLEFPDRKFSIEDPAAQFGAMMNQPGFTDNGAVGSVRDYYRDNSDGLFTPVFDIYGPVELPEECRTFYGKGNPGKTDLALIHGAQLLDDQIDFSQYDSDNDGVVDMVLYFFAGYGANVAGIDVNTHIWPCEDDLQMWDLGHQYNFDGKELGKYGCASELYGASGTRMSGMGIICHEFAHTLGLPDLYPIGLAEKMNGELYEFSLMSSNFTDNYGNSVPYFSAVERIMLGWMLEEDLLELPAGPLSFGSISGGIAYRDPAGTEGESFIFECRDGSRWDSYLPKGMLVYHLDRSDNILPDGSYAYDVFGTPQINSVRGHPCYYIVPAGFQSHLFYDEPDRTKFVFPGSLSIRSYSPVDWSGRPTGLDLTDIRYSDAEGKVSLNVSYPDGRVLKGTVTGLIGNRLEGVHVIVDGSRTAVTDKNGSFIISLKGYEGETVHVTVSKDGYRTTGIDLKLEAHFTFCQVTLSKEDETDVREFRFYDPGAAIIRCGNGVTTSQMAAIRIPAEDLDDNGGSVLVVTSSLTNNADAVYLIVDAGDRRILSYKLPSLPDDQFTIDLSSLDVDFRGQEDLYVGVAIENCRTWSDPTHPFHGVQGTGHFYLSPFDLEKSDWVQLPGVDLVLSATVVGHDTPRPEDTASSLAEMGFNAIADPGNGHYTAGSSFALKLELADGATLQSVSWTFDGNPADSSSPITLPAGTHTVKAVIHLADGTAETLELTLEAN